MWAVLGGKGESEGLLGSAQSGWRRKDEFLRLRAKTAGPGERREGEREGWERKKEREGGGEREGKKKEMMEREREGLQAT